MKSQLLRFTFFLSICLTLSTLNQTVVANSNVGEPRTVRLLYFLPNDRSYRQEVVDAMKTGILEVQSFYAEQMAAHGHGNKTFRIETDDQGDPKVHRVDGQHPDRHYHDNSVGTVHSEIQQAYDFYANIYFIVLDYSKQSERAKGTRQGKNGGFGLVYNEFIWFTATHELGHAFGLQHDFRDNAYIMSYGSPNRSSAQLSVCAAEYLAVHPYFNPDIPIEAEQPPTIDLISSPEYPVGSESVPVRLRVRDAEGLHQVLLSVFDKRILSPDKGNAQVKACRGLAGENDAVVEFNYDGEIPSVDVTSLSNPPVHEIRVVAVDTAGNQSSASFTLREVSPYEIATLSGHTDPVSSVAFSPDGTTLASGADDAKVRPGDEKIRLWNVATRENIATLSRTIYPHAPMNVNSVAFSPDGTTLASGASDNNAKLWDVATRELIGVFPGGSKGLYNKAVNSVAFSPDGTMLAAGDGGNSWNAGTVKLWDVVTKENIATLEGHLGPVTSVAFSPDGTTLASGSTRSTIKLWDVATLTNIATIDAGHWKQSTVTSVAFSPDGTILASGGASPDNTVLLWDVAAGESIALLFGHTSGVSSVVFSPDGTTLASGSYDSTIKLWDAGADNAIASFATLTGHTGGVGSVAFSPDGITLASASSDNKIKLWDTSEWAGTPVVNHAPTGAVTISGTAAVGETLTADASAVMDPDGPEMLQFSYQWLAGDVPIAGATARTYTLTENETGETTRVRASYIDGFGAPVNITSEATESVAPATTNTAPVFTDGTSITRTVAENMAANVNIGTAIAATDADNNTLTYSLSGPDAASFDFEPTTGQLKTKALLDYETKSTYTVTITVSDGTLTDTITVTINVSDVADTPVVSTLNLLSDRTPEVRAAIVEAVPDVNSAADVTEAHLAAITYLDLSYKEITALKAGDFDGLSSLGSLGLSNNPLTDLPEGVFSGLSSLKTLSLHDTYKLASLPEDVFNGLTSLTTLYLNNNKLAGLPEGVFSGLTSLESLWLSSNSLTGLPEGVFSGLSSLKTLYLTHNKLTSLPEGVFSDLSSLATLWLYNNALTSLPEGVFSGLSSLESLKLSYNQLTSLPESVFSGLSSLIELNLSGNAVDPLVLTVSLEKVADGQFKAVAPAGAPFDIILPITVTNGSISGGTTSLTIPAGSVESDVLTVTRTPSTTAAVTVDIGTLPSRPANHTGYSIVKSADLPLKVTEGDIADTLAFTMTVGRLGETSRLGFDRPRSPFWPHGSLSKQTFDFKGITHTVAALYYDIDYNTREKYLFFQTSPSFPRGFELYLDSQQFNSAAGIYQPWFNGGWNRWDNVDLNWSTGQIVQIRVIETTPMPPGAPINLQATTHFKNVTLTWEPPVNADLTSLPVEEYELRISDDGGTTWDRDWNNIYESGSGEENRSSVTISESGGVHYYNTFSNGTEYTFEVRAKGGDGPGDAARVTLVMDGITPLSSRTPQVRDAIVAEVPGVNSANDVTEAHLAAIRGSLILTDKSISALKAGDFDGLAYLSTLYLEVNQLTSLPDGVFDGLDRLTQLRLGGNQFSSLPARVFADLGSLTKLDLSNCNQLTSLSDEVFDGLDHLAVLWFHNNRQLTSLPDGVFSSLANLTFLGLGDSGLTSLPDGVFNSLTNLKSLNLWRNRLTSLPENIFDNLNTLTGLNLSSNQLSTLPAGIFDNLNALTVINLSFNQLNALPAGIFDDLNALTTLSLENNQLSALPESIFDNLSTLKVLYLYGNSVDPLPLTISLEKVAEGQFKAVAPTGVPFAIVLPLTVTNGSISGGATSVTIPIGSVESGTLTVKRMPGTTAAVTVDIGTLPGLPATHSGYSLVKSADLPLEVVAEFILFPVSNRTPAVRDAIVAAVPGVNSDADVTEAHLAAITRLSLNNKSLTSLKAGDFYGLNLESLYLENNQLTILPEGIFDGLPRLVNLQLEGNQLTALPDGVFDELSSLKTLNLTGNQLATLPGEIFNRLDLLWIDLRDNQLTELSSGVFDGQSSMTSINLDNNQLTALLKGVFDGLSSLTTIDLQNNQLASLPKGIFDGLSSLTILNLSGNAVDPMPLTVSLEKVADGQFKATAPTGAPFDIVLSLNVTNGTINGGATTITIPAGSVESDPLTVTRTSGTTPPVTVDIGTLPELPTSHQGYELVKSTDLPLEIFSRTATQVIAVNIPDSNLRAKIESALGKTSGDPISLAEMATLTSLTAQDASISNLTGLETATNLTTLKLGNNTISDISALAGLTNLTELQLWDNSISNISAVAGLTNLTTLYLWGNNISDISHLSGLTSLTHLRLGENSISNISNVSRLTNLTYLSVKENAISDISAVLGLTNLTQLLIGNNTISDITPVRNLINLTWLDMPNNRISDISVVQNLTQLVELYFQNNAVSDLLPLVANTGLGTDDELDIRGNPLSYPSIYTHIPALQARDVYIDFDNRVATASLKISGDTQQGPPSTALANPLVVEVQDANSVVFAGVPVTFAVTAGGGTLSTTNTTTDANGRAESVLTLGNTAGTNTVTVSVQGISQTATFTATAAATDIVSLSPISNRTSQVRVAIVEAVPGVNSAADVTEKHLAAITSLDLSSKNITSLQAGDFDGLTALTNLNLSGNGHSIRVPSGIFDKLTELTHLNLNRTGALWGWSGFFDKLTNLTHLYMHQSDFASYNFAGIFDKNTELTHLYLSYNGLTSLPANIFAKNTKLIHLDLHFNDFSSLPDGIFDNLTALTSLDLSGNAVNPMPLIVSLERVAEGQFKAVAPTGAPFDIALPLSITNGSISGSATNITIPKGSVESVSLSVTRTPGTTAAVTVNIGTLPGLPPNHTGYTLVKSDALPLEVTNDGSGNRAPVFTANSTTRTIAENTAAGVNIGTPVAATDADNDTLTYTLGGTDANAFNIERTTGQLRTRAALDYETKRSYTVTVTVSDGSLTDTITATINVSDIAETPANTGVCEVGDILSPGESCTYPGTDAEFSVLNNGSGQFLFFTSGNSLNIENTAINGVSYTLVANKLASGSWEIEEIGDSAETRGTTNSAPVFTDGTSTTRSVAENTSANVNIGTAIASTDADNDALTYTLSGTDAASFNIERTTGQLRTRAALDYETKRSYTVTVTVSDGSLTDTITVTINVTDIAETPANTGVCEVGDILSPGESCTYPGTDAEFSVLNNGNGQFLFFSSGNSLNIRNTTINGVSYTLVANKLASGSWEIEEIADSTAPVTTNTAPTFTEGASTTRSVAENTSANVNIGNAVAATDPENDTLTYTLSGTDAASFDIESTTGQLKTKSALDYETKSAYTVTITVSDSNLTDTITVTINVTNIAETSTATTAINIPDNNLRAKIEAALGKASGAPISAAEMETLTSLTAQDSSISNLTGLETAMNLTTLKLGDNSVSDISPADRVDETDRVAALGQLNIEYIRSGRN